MKEGDDVGSSVAQLEEEEVVKGVMEKGVMEKGVMEKGVME